MSLHGIVEEIFHYAGVLLNDDSDYDRATETTHEGDFVWNEASLSSY